MPMFSRQHYNAIAKDIREELDNSINGREFYKHDKVGRSNYTMFNQYEGRVTGLVDLALRFARRFQADNPKKPGDDVYSFRPEKFLNACSPNPDLYPLSELWEEDD